jgi:hypothetical protein
VYVQLVHTILIEANPNLVSGLRRISTSMPRFKGSLRFTPIFNASKHARNMRGQFSQMGQRAAAHIMSPIAKRTIPYAQASKGGMVFGFDWDGIIGQSNQRVAKELNRLHGTKISTGGRSYKYHGHVIRPDWHNYDIYLDKGKKFQHGEKDFSKGWYGTALWKALGSSKIKPAPGMGLALRTLHKRTGQAAIAVTARPPNLLKPAEHSMLQPTGLKKSTPYHMVATGSATKLNQLKSLGITDYMEDYPKAWPALQQAGIRVHTLDLPWTREEAKKNSKIIVHKNWHTFNRWLKTHT